MIISGNVKKMKWLYSLIGRVNYSNQCVFYLQGCCVIESLKLSRWEHHIRRWSQFACVNWSRSHLLINELSNLFHWIWKQKLFIGSNLTRSSWLFLTGSTILVVYISHLRNQWCTFRSLFVPCKSTFSFAEETNGFVSNATE